MTKKPLCDIDDIDDIDDIPTQTHSAIAIATAIAANKKPLAQHQQGAAKHK